MSEKLRQLKVLLRKDLRLFTQRPQFRLYVVLLSILVAYSVVAGVQRYRISVASFDTWQKLQQSAVAHMKYAPSLKGPGYSQRFPPAVTSIFAQGADDLITVPFVTRSWTKQQIGYFTPDGSVTRLIPSLDFLVLVLLLGGLFTIWLCHDFVLQEMTSRTIVTNVLFNVSERTFVVSKVLAMLIGAALPTLALFLLAAMAVRLFVGDVGSDYAPRCASFIVVLLLYQAFWVGVALLVQSLNVTQRTALVYGIGAWVVVSFVVPNISMISDADGRVKAVAEFMARKAVVARKVEDEFRAYRKEDKFPTLGVFEFPDYAGLVEKTMLEEGAYDRLLEATSAQTRRRLTSIRASASSPYTAAAVAATELTNTGLGTYVATRAEMLNYHRYYEQMEYASELTAWGHDPDLPTPVDAIKRLDVPQRRPTFRHNVSDARFPILGLLFDVLVVIPAGIILVARRLGGRKSSKRRLAAA